MIFVNSYYYELQPIVTDFFFFKWQAISSPYLNKVLGDHSGHHLLFKTKDKMGKEDFKRKLYPFFPPLCNNILIHICTFFNTGSILRRRLHENMF